MRDCDEFQYIYIPDAESKYRPPIFPAVIFANVYQQIALGAVSIRKTVLPGMAIPMLKIRRPNGRLIFNMEIAIRR